MMGQRKMKINYKLLSAAIYQQGPWRSKGLTVNKEWYLKEMKKKIKQLNFEKVRADVQRFIKRSELKSLELWSTNSLLEPPRKVVWNFVGASTFIWEQFGNKPPKTPAITFA